MTAAERAEIFGRIAELAQVSSSGPDSELNTFAGGMRVCALAAQREADAEDAKGEEPRRPKVGDAFWSRMERMEDSWVTETVTEVKEPGFTDSLGRLYSYADEGKTWRWPEPTRAIEREGK